MFKFVVVCLCVIIAVVDLKTYRIPDIILVFLVLTLLLPDKSREYVSITDRLLTLTVVFLLFGAIWYFTNSMGFGDVKYAAVLGYILGSEQTFNAFIYTALLGLLIYIVGVVIHKLPKTTKIPFGPFLSAGVIISVGVIP